MAPRKNTGNSSAVGLRERETNDELKKILEGLGTTIEKVSSGVARDGGSVGGAVAGGVAAAAAITGNEKLDVIAAILEKCVGILDAIASKFLPELVKDVKAGFDANTATKKVAELAGEAAAYGRPLSADSIRQRIELETSAQHRRTAGEIEAKGIGLGITVREATLNRLR